MVPERLLGRFNSTTLLVYGALKSFSWMPDGSRPSIKTVAEKLGISPRTVKRSIHELEKAGVLGREPRFRDSAHKRPLPNRYTFPVPPKNLPGGGDTSDPSDTHVTRGGDTHDTRAVTNLAPEVDIPEVDKEEIDGIRLDAYRVRDYFVDSQEVQPGSEEGVDNLEDVDDVDHTRLSDSLATNRNSSTRVESNSKPDYNKPLPDPAVEAQAEQIVELLDGLRVADHQNPVGPARRLGWLKSARITLDSDHRPFDEVCRLIRWACEDGYWSTKIIHVYMLRQHYQQLLDESAQRKPRRKEKTSAFDKRIQKAASEAISPEREKAAAAGFSRLEDL